MKILFLKMFQWNQVKKFYITIYLKALYESKGFYYFDNGSYVDLLAYDL
jgi:hypothetical protein